MLEHHVELLGSPLSSTATFPEPIFRGSISSDSWDPAPTAKLYVAGKLTGANGAGGGWDVTVRDASGTALSTVAFRKADFPDNPPKTIVKAAPSSLSSAFVSLGSIDAVPVTSAPTDLAGTIEIRKAYVKLHQSGPIKKTQTRVPMASYQSPITDQAFAAVVGTSFYRHTAADFSPAPEVRLRVGGKIAAGTGDAVFRLVNPGGTVVPITPSFSSTSDASELSDPIDIPWDDDWRLEVKVDAAATVFTMYAADLVLSQSTASANGICRSAAYYPSVIAPTDVVASSASSALALLSFPFLAPGNAVFATRSMDWALTAQTSTGSQTLITLKDENAGQVRATGAAFAINYEPVVSTIDGDTPPGNVLDTRGHVATLPPGTSQTSGSTGPSGPNAPRVSASAMRIAADLADCLGPQVGILSASPLAFSPDDNGIADKDEVTFSASVWDHSYPLDYSLVVKDSSGTAVRTLTGSGIGSAGTLTRAWDGRNDAGAIVAEGTYGAVLTVEDAWGAPTTVSLPNTTVTVDTTAPTLTALTVSQTPFSPNNDGVKDTTTLGSSVSEVLPWTLEIKNASSQIVRTLTGTGTTVSALWNGNWPATLANGTYTGHLRTEDPAGNRAAVVSGDIVLDTIAPTVAVSASPNPFEPANGDTQITGTVGEAVPWTLEVRLGASTIRSLASGTGTSVSSSWNGRNDADQLVADNAYHLRLAATDLAGNVGVTPGSSTVRVDTSPPVISLPGHNPNPFSPNGDGVKDTTTLYAVITDLAPVTYTLEVRDSADTLLRTFTGSGSVSKLWDGKDTAGVIQPNGNYNLKVIATDSLGHAATRSDGIARIDLVGPSPTFSGPTAGSAISGAASLTSGVTDVSGITQVGFHLRERWSDGTVGSWTLLGTDTTAPFANTLETQPLAPGTIDLGVSAKDGQGLVSGITGIIPVDIDNGEMLTPQHWTTERSWAAGDLIGLQVNPFYGGLRVAIHGGHVNAAGPPESVDLVHSSRSRQKGPLGYGWSLGGIDRLQLTSTAATFHGGDGSRMRFALVAGAYQRPPGVFATLVRNADDTYDLADRGGFIRHFDANGRVLTVSDRNGRTRTLTYDGFGNVISIAHPSGGITTLTYTADLLATITDSASRVTALSYAEGDLTGVTNALGNAVGFGYDAAHNLTSLTDFGGHAYAITYGTTGLTDRVASVQEPTGATTTFGFGSVPLPLTRTVTNPLNKTTTYTFNAAGASMSQVDPLGVTSSYTRDAERNVTVFTDALNKTWTSTYDPFGNLLTRTDPLNRTTTYVYNSQSLVTSSTDALNRTTSYTYDAAGNRTSRTTPRSGATLYTYDAVGNLTHVQDPLGNVTTSTYDSKGRRLTQQLPLGETTTFAYDLAGNTASVTDPMGAVTTSTHDAFGRKLSSTNALLQTTTSNYDANGDLVSSTDPLNATTTYTYDAVGNRVSSATPLSHQTLYAFDAVGRLTSVTAPSMAVTAYGYDAADRRTSETDSRGNVTTFAYDAIGRKTTTTDSTGTALQSYDAAGNRISRTDKRGKVTTYAYDVVGQWTSETDPLGNKTTYGYDADGHRTGVTDPRGNVAGADPALYTTTTAFDLAGRIITRTVPNRGATTYSYDADGRKTSETRSDGAVTTFAYDPASRLISVTDADLNKTGYTYDVLGRIVGIVDPRGYVAPATPRAFTTAYAYDAAGRLVSVTDPSGSAARHVYDADGNLTSNTDGRGSFAGDPAFSTTAVYDVDGRASSISDASGGTVVLGYDSAGNVTSRNDGVATATFAHDALNRRIRATFPDINSPTGGTLTVDRTFDSEGHLTRVVHPTGVTDASYDDAGQVSSVTTPAGSSSYLYDRAGNQTSTTVPSGSSPTAGVATTCSPTVQEARRRPSRTVLIPAWQGWPMMSDVWTRSTIRPAVCRPRFASSPARPLRRMLPGPLHRMPPGI